MPRTLSMLCSYKTERRMIKNYLNSDNYLDIWDKSRVLLLRFGYDKDRPANMTNLTLFYPCMRGIV